MTYPFEITDDDINCLGQSEAVAFFRRLLWAEAAFAGVSQALISVPTCINTSDGGLDARIEWAEPKREDIIPNGSSGFQIKAKDLRPEECKREIQHYSDPNSLGPMVEWLMRRNGTYVLVLYAKISDLLLERRKDALRAEFSRLGYHNAKVRIYTSTHLVGFANRFPSVALSLKPDFQSALDYESWGGNVDVREPKQFVADEKRSTIIMHLRKRLRNRNGECPIDRILGLSGLGKTRLVFETLAEPDLKNQAIYASSDAFCNSQLLHALQRDAELSAILVVDECSTQDHDFLVRQLASRGGRLALITLSADIEGASSRSGLIVLDPLTHDCIEKILRNENPSLPRDTVDRITDFAEGYPKIATLLSENIDLSRGDSPEDLLMINDERLLNRMIAGSLDSRLAEVSEIKRALKAFSIFTRVGWKGVLNEEAKWVARKFGFVSDDNWNRFVEIVKQQRERRILQGENFLYVTPFPLAVHLMREWLEERGDFLDLQQFFDGAPQDLLERFHERIPYMGGVAAGIQAIEKLLGDTGPFADGRLLKTESGAEFFLHLTEAAPEIALRRLNRAIGHWRKEDLLDFTEGRQYIVWSLERIAVWSELFQDAARLLLSLGEAETEHTYSNNASGIFCEFFRFGPGPVASTEAPPEIRIPILAEALGSESKERKLLALRACGEGLSIGPYSRHVGPEFQGGRAVANLWHPRTYGELFDAYREIWSLLLEQITSPDDEIRDNALEIILDRAEGLIQVTNIAPLIIETFEKLAKLHWLDKRKLIGAIERINRYARKNVPPTILKRLRSLRDQLVGTDFNGLLNRYVGMDLFEDKIGEEGEETEKLDKIFDDLAQQVVESPEKLKPHISWLVSADAENGYRFGYALGKADSNFSLLQPLIDIACKEEDSTAFFLGGYLRRVFENKQELWETTLSEIAQHPNLRRLLPEITWRSGITDRAAIRILGVARGGGFDIEEFRIFSYGGVVRSLTKQVFEQWAKFLLEEPTGVGAEILLDLYIFYYGREQEDKPVPKKLTLDLLCHEVFFGGLSRLKRRQSVEHHWKDLAKKLIRQYPETAKELRKVLLNSFGVEDSIVSSHYSAATDALDLIARDHPTETWHEVANLLKLPYDTRSFHLTHWLRGEKGLEPKLSGSLALFDPADLWKWVDKDIEKRAELAARFIPPFLFHSKDESCYARELLIRYGDRDDVRSSFAANYWSGAWSGPESMHHLSTIAELEEFNKNETNPRVRAWVEGYTESLRRDLQRARIEEEREGR
jgi:hypothetical protein